MKSKIAKPSPSINFSLVIPVLNEEKLLPQCLDSIKNLNYPKDRYEVIIIDNGSSDRSVEIAKSYGFKVVVETRRGIIQARQRGLDEARGKYYITTDADATVPRNWLNTAYREFSKKGVVGLTGPVRINDRTNFFSNLIFSLTWILSRCAVRKMLYGCNMAFDVRAARRVGGFTLNNFKYYEDAIISVRLQKVGKIQISEDFSTKISFRRYEGIKFLRSFRNIVNYVSFKYLGILATDRFNTNPDAAVKVSLRNPLR